MGRREAREAVCQGRSKTRPVRRSKSRPVDGDEVIEYVGGEGALERCGRGPFAPEARSEDSGLGAVFAAALLESVAVAVHLEDVDMMGGGDRAGLR
jgi:hypothetical protein